MKLKPARHLIPIQGKAKPTEGGVKQGKKAREAERNKMKTYEGDPKSRGREIRVPLKRKNYNG